MRRAGSRFFGGAAIASLQMLILLTGNYTFFNFLTLALCLLLLDDFAFQKITAAQFGHFSNLEFRFAHRAAGRRRHDSRWRP